MFSSVDHMRIIIQYIGRNGVSVFSLRYSTLCGGDPAVCMRYYNIMDLEIRNI